MSDQIIFDKKVIAYALYDWATSPLLALHTTFVFAVYFTTAVLPEGGTVAWSQMTAFAAIIVATLAPIAGTIADRHAMWKSLLMLMTVGGSISSAVLWIIEPDPSFAIMALVLSAITIVTMELASVFYNALIPSISTRQTVGRVSGFSWGIGYIGGIICLGLVLVVFILPETAPFGLSKIESEHIRIIMPLAALWVLIFAVPLFLFVPEGSKIKGSFTTNLKEGFYIVISTPGLLRFMVARMFYADAFVTLFAFGGIFAAKVFGFTQTDVLIFAMILNTTAGIGAILGGIADDRLGAITTIRTSIIVMIILGILIIIASSPVMFWILGGCLGAFVGPVQSASRSHIARMAPAGTEARVFGFLMLTGKATAFIGPLLYGWIVLISGQERYGMLVVIAMLVIGLFLLKSTQAATSTDPI
jgi:UMF1 family MFS transporter